MQGLDFYTASRKAARKIMGIGLPRRAFYKILRKIRLYSCSLREGAILAHFPAPPSHANIAVWQKFSMLSDKPPPFAGSGTESLFIPHAGQMPLFQNQLLRFYHIKIKTASSSFYFSLKSA